MFGWLKGKPKPPSTREHEVQELDEFLFGKISTWTRDLAGFLHIKPAVDTGEFRVLFAKRDFTGLIGAIKTGFALDLRMRVGFVNSGGSPTAPAWIHLPKPMPPYGTEGFRRALATMYVRKYVRKEVR
jgi:hypothetical protein